MPKPLSNSNSNSNQPASFSQHGTLPDSGKAFAMLTMPARQAVAEPLCVPC